MASTVLPNGIIIPEKYSRDWYADLYHNWQELDNLLGGGGGGANDGTLTIQKNGDTVGTFSANQATDETINIEVPTKTSDLNNDSGFITGVAWDDVTNKPSFATVATSGSYTDLSDKPTIPTVNDATLTIQKNGTTVGTFSANQATNETINITVPTATSELTNDSNFVESSDLATVATSGSYTDLSNKPTIPTVNNATLTIQKNGTTIDTFTANASTDKTVNITVPTATSGLTNDSNFITSAIKEGNFGNSMAGWCLLYGDLLIQWGSNTSSSRDFRINFTKPFSAVPTIVANYGDTSNYSTICAVHDAHATYFNAIHSTDGAWRINWIAIGRKGD